MDEEEINGLMDYLRVTLVEEGGSENIAKVENLVNSMKEYRESATAKVAEMENALADKDAIINSLKAQNFDLLMAVDGGENPDVVPDGSQEINEDESITFEDMLEYQIPGEE